MILLAVALVGVAVVANGFDVQNLKVTSQNIWILQKGSGERYGSVNTTLSELTSANAIAGPSELLQSEKAAILFAGADGFTPIDTANPQNYTDDPAALRHLPKGVVAKDIAGDQIAFIAGNRELYLATIENGSVSDPTIVPMPDGNTTGIRFNAVSIASDGTIYVLSTDDSTVRQYSPAKSEWTSLVDKLDSLESGKYQITSVDKKWAVLLADNNKLWVSGSKKPKQLSAPGGSPQLQTAAPKGDSVYVASLNGLEEINLSSGAIRSVVSGVSGTPAKPVYFDKGVFAAWVPASSAGGSFYSSRSGEVGQLDYNGKDLLTRLKVEPVIQTNGSTAVVNEAQSGWAWRLPDGQLIKSTQNWDLTKKKDSQVPGTKEEVVSDPRPPVAVDDSFGVRAGTLVALPVMLNDHDPNEDVLSVDPSTLGSLGSFGTARVSNDGQMIVVDVAKGASGGTSFRYKVTDGTSENGRSSDFATVRLRVVSAGGNAAPQWCDDAVDGCLYSWPQVQVQPGGTVSIQALTGWVDPDGDRMFVSAVDVPAGSGSAGYTDEGLVVYKNQDSGAKSGSVELTVHVSDIRGKEATKSLTIEITPKPDLRLTAFEVTTAVGHEQTIDISKAVAGATGNFRLTSAKAKNGSSPAEITVTGPTTFKVLGKTPEQVVVAFGVRDEKGDASSTVRVNIVNVETDTISSNPVTVLVSPGLDTSVDLFAATMNPAGKALVISNIEVEQNGKNVLFADKIRNGIVRFTGETDNNLPGYLGKVTYTVSDGSKNSRYSATGQAFVYQLAEPKNSAPIGVTDQVVIRSGEVMDVDVLGNDVGEPGLPLHIDAKSLNTACMEGGLVFANGGKLRVLAPEKAGTYTCSYSVYATGNPGLKDTADLIIDVIPSGSNTAPVPVELYGRVNAGESVTIVVPLQSMDSDGDVVSLSSVGPSTYGNGYASLSPERNAIIFTARPDRSGQDEFSYTVTDAKGAKGSGVVRVGILNAETDNTPVAMVDFTEVVQGSGNRTVIDPIANDFDPRGQALTLVPESLVPDAPPGSAIYKQMKSAISKVKGNSVTFTATDKPMNLRYIYRVTNESGSIAKGNIVVKVAAKVGIYYPEISDTYVGLADLGNLRNGIDVITKKVIWAAGDASKLSVSIWGDAKGLSVSGKKIKGSPDRTGGIVIFTATGKDYAGNEVTGYGLMHLPDQDKFVITLDPTKARQEVKENASVTFDMADLVLVPSGVKIAVDPAGVASLDGVRPNAKCTVSGTKVTYTAGAGEPWEDGCVVPVGQAGTGVYTTLLVPISVIPQNPEPLLSKARVPVDPGPSSAQDFDLATITSWVEHTQDDIKGLKYNFEYTGSHFKVSLVGQLLHIEALANMPVGIEDEVTITVQGHSATKPTTVTLVMGKNPNADPNGGNLTLDCHGKDGTCVGLVGQLTGTYNAFEDTPLVFAPFGYSAGTPNYSSKANAVYCPGRPDIKVVASATKLTVTWDAAKSPSAECTLSYRVLDREGASGPGTLNLSLQGVPDQLGQVRQVGYSRTTVRLEINAGRAALSVPEIEGYNIYEGAAKRLVASCDLTRAGEIITYCKISGLTPYDGVNKANLHQYTVTAYNREGDSPKSSTVSNVYSYIAPKAITRDIFIKVESKSGGAVSAQFGVAAVTISPVEDPLVKEYEISSDAGEKITHVLDGFGNFTEDIVAKPGTSSRITVRAIASVPPPGKSLAPDASASWAGNIAGAPTLSAVKASILGTRSPFSGKVAANASRNYSRKVSHIAYILWHADTAPGCTLDTKNNVLKITNAPSATTIVVTNDDTDYDNISGAIESGEISNLKDFTTYKTKICYTNGYAKVEALGNELSTLGDPNDGDFSFIVNSQATSVAGGGFEWKVALKDKASPSGVVAQFNGSKPGGQDFGWSTDIYSKYYGEPSVIRVRYCTTKVPVTCSAGDRLVTQADDTRAWQLKVTRAFLADANGNPSTATCRVNENLFIGLEGEGLGDAVNKNWSGGETQQGETAQYQIGTTWYTFSTRGTYWKLPSTAKNVVRIRVYIAGNQTTDGPTAVRGLDGEQPIEFAVNCN